MYVYIYIYIHTYIYIYVYTVLAALLAGDAVLLGVRHALRGEDGRDHGHECDRHHGNVRHHEDVPAVGEARHDRQHGDVHPIPGRHLQQGEHGGADALPSRTQAGVRLDAQDREDVDDHDGDEHRVQDGPERAEEALDQRPQRQVPVRDEVHVAAKPEQAEEPEDSKAADRGQDLLYYTILAYSTL